MLTLVQLQQVIRFKSDAVCLQWYSPMIGIFEKYQINTPQRIAAFLAQTAHESNGYTTLSENLKYSADGLTKTFKKYFPTLASTIGYARDPVKIANKVYSNRMGNGDEDSGDGWTYRGRGLIQLTGKNNYTKFAASLGKNVTETIAYLDTKEGALESAAWFWDTNKLNKYADSSDIKGMTKVINGGDIGLSVRQERFDKALTVLS